MQIIAKPLNGIETEKQIQISKQAKLLQKCKENLPNRQVRQQKELPIQLPLWPEQTRGTPNAWLRSSLFAAIQGKTRRALKRELLASVNGVQIKFTGWQLDRKRPSAPPFQVSRFMP